MEKAQELFVANLKRRLDAREWAAPDLARATGYSRQFTHRLMAGENSPTPETLDRIAAALECEVADLLAGQSKWKTATPEEAIRVLSNFVKSAQNGSKKIELGNIPEEILRELSALDNDEAELRVLKDFLRARRNLRKPRAKLGSDSNK